MPTFALGDAVDLDIYLFESEGGSAVDPDGYSGGTEPTLKIYDRNGTLVHEETDNSNITRLSEGHFRFTDYTIPVTAPTGTTWRIVWMLHIDGNLLAAAVRTEYFTVTAGGAAAYGDPYDNKSEVVEFVEGVTVDDIKEGWRDWAKTIIDQECQHDFYAHDAGTEVHDIDRDYQDTVILRHWPTITVTRLRDGVNGVTSSTPTTISSDHYHVYHDARLSLVSSAYSCFSKGRVNVDVQYTYGYTEVPGDVVMLANFLVAFRAQVWLLEKESEEKGAFGAKKIVMADYEETFGQDLKMIESKFGDKVTGGATRMMALVKRDYAYGIV